MLVPAVKANNNIGVVCRLHYINTLKQELDGTGAYQETDNDEMQTADCRMMLFPLLLTRMYATPYHISCIIFILDSRPSYTDKLLEFRWVKLRPSLFLYCYKGDFMDSLNNDNQADFIEAFNSTSTFLDDLLNIDNRYLEGMVNQIYPHNLQLDKANTTDTEASFLDLHLSFANRFVSS